MIKTIHEVKEELKNNNLVATLDQELEVLELVTSYGLDFDTLKLNEYDTIEDLLGKPLEER